jgi:hypothetical protein
LNFNIPKPKIIESINNKIYSAGPVCGNFFGVTGTTSAEASPDLNNTHSLCSELSIVISPSSNIL